MIEKSIEESLILNIFEMVNQLKKNGDIISQQVGITTQQWLILLHLANDPNIPFFEKNKHQKPLLASELAASMNVSRPNITNLVNVLLQKKLVMQVEDEVDRRRKRLQLTKEGEQLLKVIEPGRRASNKKLFSDLTKSEKEVLLQQIKSFCKKLEND